jgi:hypothetical protein
MQNNAKFKWDNYSTPKCQTWKGSMVFRISGTIMYRKMVLL